MESLRGESTLPEMRPVHRGDWHDPSIEKQVVHMLVPGVGIKKLNVQQRN